MHNRKNSMKQTDQIFWCADQAPTCKPCTDHSSIEVAIIGGGMAGLAAAQAFAKRNKKVAVIEKYFCGAGATGKSGGFITPNAELSLSDFAQHTDMDSAQTIWKFIHSGIETIRNNITKLNFDCDYKDNTGLFLANCPRTLKKLKEEHNNISKLGYESQFFDTQQLQKIVNSTAYAGGMTYQNSFGINPYQYCNALKHHLIDQGVQIFENSPVLETNDHTIKLEHATVQADHIIVCVDKYLPDLNKLQDYVYHAQNHVLVSKPLTDEQVEKIFPGKPYMIWDSQLIYNYYRLMHDQRLLIGGGDIFSVYSQQKHNYKYGKRKLSNYIKKTFPDVSVDFEYQWSGLIGISKDIGPIAGPDKKHPHIYYITASAGLPVATAIANYSVEYLLDQRTDFDEYFRPDRKYFIGPFTQKILGKKLSFAINNFISQDTVGCF